MRSPASESCRSQFCPFPYVAHVHRKGLIRRSGSAPFAGDLDVALVGIIREAARAQNRLAYREYLVAGDSCGPGTRTAPTRYTRPRLLVIASTAMITVA